MTKLRGENRQLQQQYRAVSQYLWLLVQDKCPTGEIKLRTDTLDPLWQLCFVQVEGENGEIDTNRVHILSATMPPMSDQDKKRVVRRLRGTGERNLPAVLKELNIDHEYPPHYVETRVGDRIKWSPETKIWEPATSSEES